jgi:peptidoglycan/xylan/chitin deacetylase (PgdA/CDA1 family)
MKRGVFSSVFVGIFVLFAFCFCGLAAAAQQLEKGMVTFTFDDGDISLYENALPILVRYNVVATAYIIPSVVGEPYAVSWSQIKTMQTDHGFEIANHTWNHPSLLALTNKKIKLQVFQAEMELSDHGIFTSGAFAPPYGEYNDQTIKVLKNMGTVTSSRQAWTGNGNFLNFPASFDRWQLKVVGTTDAPTYNDMEYVLDQTAERNGYTILVFHGIWPNPEVEYETTPEFLEQIVQHASDLRDQGLLNIVTVSQGVNKLAFYQLK